VIARFTTICVALVALAVLAAQAQTGPVGQACKADIAKFCASQPHDGRVRVCLETNYDQVSAGCKKALDTTGGGRGQRMRGTPG
jgi:hypothetical protein